MGQEAWVALPVATAERRVAEYRRWADDARVLCEDLGVRDGQHRVYKVDADTWALFKVAHIRAARTRRGRR
jgi:hypothetical protein